MLNTIREYADLNPLQISVVQLTVAHANGCQYRVVQHTKMMGHDQHVVLVKRQDRILEDPALESLRDTTLLILRNQGRLSIRQLRGFYDAGFSRRAVFDVVTCMVSEIIANYTNQLNPVDLHLEPLITDLPYREHRAIAWIRKVKSDHELTVYILLG